MDLQGPHLVSVLFVDVTLLFLNVFSIHAEVQIFKMMFVICLKAHPMVTQKLIQCGVYK